MSTAVERREKPYEGCGEMSFYQRVDDSTTCVGRLEARLDYAYRLVTIDTRLSMQHE